MLGVIDLNADVGESFGNMTSGLDEEIPILAKNRALIEDKNCMLLSPSEQALKTALDKKETFHVLKDRVLQPKTFFLDGLVDYGKIYNELSGRVVIKITSSRGGRDIYFPDDVEEYEFYLRKAEKMSKEQKREFMIQEVIEGDEYNITTLHDLEGKLIYSFSRRKFEKRKIKSTTTAAVIETQTDVVEQALAAIEVLKLKPGFNNVEVICSRKDSKPYFIEVNGGRTAAQDMNVVAAGVNISWSIPNGPAGTSIRKTINPTTTGGKLIAVLIRDIMNFFPLNLLVEIRIAVGIENKILIITAVPDIFIETAVILMT